MNSTWTVLATACLMIGVLIAESRREGHNHLSGYKDAKEFMLSFGSIYSFLDPVILTKTRAVDISAVHERALNDFKGRFGRVKPETWYQVAGGWISYLQTAEYEHHGFYTKKGTGNVPSENSLSNAIRALVKSNYYDYKITMVEELSGHYGKNYILHLENESGIKLLRVTENEELDLIHEYSKSKLNLPEPVRTD